MKSRVDEAVKSFQARMLTCMGMMVRHLPRRYAAVQRAAMVVFLSVSAGFFCQIRVPGKQAIGTFGELIRIASKMNRQMWGKAGRANLQRMVA
jgi:hypothetical protein